MTLVELAYKLRPIVEQAAQSLDDATASKAVTLHGTLKYDGSLVKNGTRIKWGNVLKRAAVDLWDREENNPDNAPDLWEDVLYRDGIRIIPEVITVGLVFANGEKGWWGDDLYVSLLDANNYTPEQHPRGWKLYVKEEE